MQRSNERITRNHLQKIAYVYVRQSKPEQVENCKESKRRQYALADLAAEYGFANIQVNDLDQGISGAEAASRKGFQTIVADVSLGKVGIIFCLEVSRLARNNRDWYHLMDLCSLFGTLIADQDGVYDPAKTNDRLVLGLKGTMSELELRTIKNRMDEGAKAKARRGELILALPAGFEKGSDNTIIKDPNKRVRNAIQDVFERFKKTRTVRQTLLWFLDERIDVPIRIKSNSETEWCTPKYGTILGILQNPIYAGAYAYGKTASKTVMNDGNIAKSRGYRLPIDQWQVLIKDHHSGYILWKEFLINQDMISANRKNMFEAHPGAVGKGAALLAGLMRCGLCGNKIRVAYNGANGKVPRYICRYKVATGGKSCFGMGGKRIEDAVTVEIVKITQPLAIEASVEAIRKSGNDSGQKIARLNLELQAAEYEANRAYKQYDKVDPENRLVADQLEDKWNISLKRVESIRARIEESAIKVERFTDGDQRALRNLSQDFERVWNAPSTTIEMKKNLSRALIQEIIIWPDDKKCIAHLKIHWKGGVHTDLEVAKNKPGEHTRRTDLKAIELIKKLVTQLDDSGIASVMNRLGITTGVGNRWTESRVYSMRNYRKILPFDPSKKTWLNLKEAALALKISQSQMRKLIEEGKIKATQIVPFAPWIVQPEDLLSAKRKGVISKK